MIGVLRRLRRRLPMRCRYEDCIEGHRVANEHEAVTCPACRRYLGLPPAVQR